MRNDENKTPTPVPMARFVPVTLIKPGLAAAVGIDGGAIFQVLAVENLQLSPVAIGTAFGLGLLSIPLQLWAGRIPIRLARRNVQIFLVLAAVQSAVLALLLALEATGGLAATALVVTVTAEIAISVLFVTAWQPLLSRASTRDRQRLNAGWTALGKGLLAGLVIVFSAAETVGRSMLLVALSVLAIGIAVSLRGITSIGPTGPAPLTSKPNANSARVDPAMWWILASFFTLNLGALPLWLVYLSQVLWPTADLGIIAAIQTVAVVGALLAWRTTGGGLGRRAVAGVLLVFGGSVALVGIGEVAQNRAEHALVLIVTITMTFGLMYASLALLEIGHRLVAGKDSVVRTFTLIDVVDSSALQLGLFVGGLLVASSASTMGWTPYVVFVVAMSTLSVAAVGRTAWLTRDALFSAP